MKAPPRGLREPLRCGAHRLSMSKTTRPRRDFGMTSIPILDGPESTGIGSRSPRPRLYRDGRDYTAKVQQDW